MTLIIGSANTAKPIVEGMTRNATNRKPFERVGPKSAEIPPMAARESAGRVTVATATPKMPIGNCIKRNAQLSQLTAPAPTCTANIEFTTTLI